MDLVRLLLKEDSQHRQDEHWSCEGIRADSLRLVMAKNTLASDPLGDLSLTAVE